MMAIDAQPGAPYLRGVQRECAERPGMASICSHTLRRFPRCFPGYSPVRVWSVIQFTSHVLPPSSENDCSK